MSPSRKSLSGKLIFLLGAVLILGACNYPGLRTQTVPESDLVFTSAAETVEAGLTPGVLTATTGAPPTATTPPAAPTNTQPGITPAPPTATSIPPSATATPRCDLVKFVSDVTIPDNTELGPGAVFEKTWRLRNAGTCTWTSAYALVYEGDNVLSAPPSAPLTAAGVPPGGTVDVSVTLTAPSAAGTYRQNFKLANASGQRFGLGDGSKPFWAQIKVSVPTGIVYDFLAQAPNPATAWKSGAGDTFDTTLAFGGADDDANGAAKFKEGVKLETGLTSGKVLLTFPKHTVDGVIAGIYPPYLVQQGDRLKARLGFIARPDGSCGVGEVSFQVLYQEGGTTNLLGAWNKTCNGTLQPIDINLSSLAGHTVQVIFLVRSRGDFTEDWAIWNSPRIER